MAKTWNPLDKEFYTDTINPISNDSLFQDNLLYRTIGEPVNLFDKDSMWQDENNWVNDKLSDMSGNNAARKADREKKNALNKAESATERMFDKSMQTQRPWLEAGARGLGQLESGINSGQFNTDPGKFQQEEFQFDFEADPGYQFRLEQGMKALEGSAAARGGLFSSNTGDRIQDYAQGLASQEYGNAYNRARGEYTQDRNFASNDFMNDFNRRRSTNTDQYNRLAALSGTGQLSAGNIGNQQMAQGGNLANIAQQRGNINANAAMGGYNRGMDFLNTGLNVAGTALGLANLGGGGRGMQPHKNVPEVPLY